MKILARVWSVLISLRFAVLVIVALAASLAVGTVLESYYDTRTAGYFVYRALWFKGLLATLGSIILCVALSRFPWRKSHTPFLLAHLGILLLLFGSWVSQKYGIDGRLRVREGQTSGAVDFDDEVLTVSDGVTTDIYNVNWAPPISKFQTINIPKHGLRVDEMISHAEPVVAFRSPESGEPDQAAAPALHLRIAGGPMKISQEFWLWAGDPAWATASMGPARFVVLPKSIPGPSKMSTPGEAFLEFWIDPKAGDVRYRAVSRRGEVKEGRFDSDKFKGAEIDPGWMTLKLTVLDWVPRGLNKTSYQRSKIQFGDRAPPPAIRVSVGNSSAGAAWLGLGDTAVVQTGAGKSVNVTFTTRRVILPFGIRLDRFNIDHYQGTMNPSSYSSRVGVVGKDAPQEPVVISMNEPLSFGGYIFYQASYIPEAPRPVTSIFSVNYDPGRWMKYLGSLLIVLGSILLFAGRKIRKVKEKAII